MKELWKNQYKNLILVMGYIIVASIVYGTWFWYLWKLWYIVLITIIVIIGIGSLIGYFYIKSVMDKDNKSNQKES